MLVETERHEPSFCEESVRESRISGHLASTRARTRCQHPRPAGYCPSVMASCGITALGPAPFWSVVKRVQGASETGTRDAERLGSVPNQPKKAVSWAFRFGSR